MGYRSFSTEPPRPRRTMQDTTTPFKVYAHNGTKAHLAVPCFYQEVSAPIRMGVHDRDKHDHDGWPDPRRKDDSCQLYHPFEAGYSEPDHTVMGGHPPVKHLLNGSKLVPIHLSSEYEGYKSIEIAWVGGEPEGISARGSIDSEQDWIVRIDFDIASKAAVYSPETHKFSAFAIAQDRRDLVALGELVVLPAAIAMPN